MHSQSDAALLAFAAVVVPCGHVVQQSSVVWARPVEKVPALQ